MKKVFKYFTVAAAIISAGFTACTKDSRMDGDDPGAVDKALLTVTISDANSATRDISDSNATEDETKIESATIFVFNAQNAYQADTTVDLSALSEDGDNKYKIRFDVPTGNGKRIYVALNFNEAMRDSIKLKGLTAMTYSITDQDSLFYKSTVTPPRNFTFKGTPMFNAAPVIVDIVKGNGNEANVTVERMTSKITVVREGALAGTAAIKAANATFDRNEIYFAIGNKNTKIYPMKEQTAGIDPNWDGDIDLYKKDFVSEFKIKDTPVSKWDLSKFVKVDDNANVAVDKRKTKYAFENTHKNPRRDELTFVAVKAKFTPDAIATDFDDATKRPVLNTNPTGVKMDSLFSVIDNNSYYYYTDKTKAKKHVDYLNQAAGSVVAEYVTYYNQQCFFAVWLNSDPTGKEFQVKRNEYYDIGLANISRLGESYPEPKPGSGTDIIGETSSIEVNIHISPWSLVGMNGVILGD
jgi:hypothetical protein